MPDPTHATLIEQLQTRRAVVLQQLHEPASPARTIRSDVGEQVVDLDRHRGSRAGRTQLTVELGRIDAALARHARGAYGICCSCELDVEPERLLQDPSAAFCIACYEEVAEERRRQGYLVR